MEITVNREKMIGEIKKDLEEYEEDYKKSIEVYKRKLAEFSKYIEKIVQKGSTESLKSPPYPPKSRKDEFDDSLQMLNAHVGETLKMDDDEYRSLKSGLNQLKMSNVSTVSALSALSY